MMQHPPAPNAPAAGKQPDVSTAGHASSAQQQHGRASWSDAGASEDTTLPAPAIAAAAAAAAAKQADTSQQRVAKGSFEKPAQVLTGDTLIKHLRTGVKKEQTMRQYPIFLIYMLAANVAMLMVSVDSTDSQTYYRGVGTKQDLGVDDFMGITGKTTFWAWAIGTVPKLWPLQRGESLKSPNRPLSYLVLRQYRVLQVPLDNPSEYRLLTAQVKEKLRKRHYPGYKPKYLAKKAFGRTPTAAQKAVLGTNAPPWHTNNNFPPGQRFRANGMKLRGQVGSYADTDYAYSLFFDLQNQTLNTEKQLQELQTLGWVDGATRVIVLDLLSYNEAQGTFLMTSMMVEYETAGVVVPSIVNRPFQIHNMSELRFRVVFVLDTIGLVMVIIELGLLMTSLARTAMHDGSSDSLVGYWMVIQLIHFVVLVAFYVRKFNVWFPMFPDAPPGDDTSMQFFHNMATYAHNYEITFTSLAIVNVIAWVRVFSFLQYNDTFGVLTGTISGSSGLLIAWIITFLIIFLPFAMSGYLLFGNRLVGYSSLSSVSVTLMMMIARGAIDNFTEMEKMYPFWTPLYFVVYLVLEWLIMLNMFIAIIIATFIVVKENRKLPGKKQELPHIAAFNWLRKQGRAQATRVRKMLKGKKSKRARAEPEQKMTESDVYEAIDKLRDLGCDDDGNYDMQEVELTEQECCEYIGDRIPEKEIHRIYERVARESNAVSASKTVSERWTYQTEKKVEYADMIFPSLRSLEPLLKNTSGLNSRLQSTQTRFETEFQPFIVAINELARQAFPLLAQTSIHLPHVKDAESAAHHMVTRQTKVLQVSEEQRKISREANLPGVIARLAEVMERRGVCLSQDSKPALWGLTQQEYDEVSPVVLDSRPGKGTVARVEKVGRRTGLYPESPRRREDLEPKHDGYTAWLEDQLGEDNLETVRVRTLERELEEQMFVDLDEPSPAPSPAEPRARVTNTRFEIDDTDL